MTKRPSFYHWLMQYLQGTTALSEFARKAARDDTFPRTTFSVEDILRHTKFLSNRYSAGDREQIRNIFRLYDNENQHFRENGIATVEVEMHADKEVLQRIADEIGLDGQASRYFLHATTVSVEYSVDREGSVKRIRLRDDGEATLNDRLWRAAADFVEIQRNTMTFDTASFAEMSNCLAQKLAAGTPIPLGDYR